MSMTAMQQKRRTARRGVTLGEVEDDIQRAAGEQRARVLTCGGCGCCVFSLWSGEYTQEVRCASCGAIPSNGLRFTTQAARGM